MRKKGKVPRVLLAVRVPEQLRRELAVLPRGDQVTRALREHVER